MIGLTLPLPWPGPVPATAAGACHGCRGPSRLPPPVAEAAAARDRHRDGCRSPPQLPRPVAAAAAHHRPGCQRQRPNTAGFSGSDVMSRLSRIRVILTRIIPSQSDCSWLVGHVPRTIAAP